MMKLALKKKSTPVFRSISLFRILVGILTLQIFLHLRHSNILSDNNQGGGESADRFGSGGVSNASTTTRFLGGGIVLDSVQGAAVDLPFEAGKTARLGGKVNSSSSTGGDILPALEGEESKDGTRANGEKRWIRATRVKRRSSPQQKIIEEAREVLKGGSEEGADDPPGEEKQDPLMGVLSAQDNWDLKRIESALKFEIVEAQKEGGGGGLFEEHAAEGGAEEDEAELLLSETTSNEEPGDTGPHDSEPQNLAGESEPEEAKPQTPRPVQESRPEPTVETPNPETPVDAGSVVQLSPPEVARNQAERRRLLQRRINEQLAPFKKGGFTYADVAAQKSRIEMSVHFIIEPGNITLIKDPDELSDKWSYWFRADQVRQLFELLSEQKRIPDHVEIVVNIQASPRLNRSVETPDLPPVLSYCSTADHYDLIGIGWQYHRCLKEKYKDNDMCKVGWDPDVIRKEHPWGGREGQALWRGSPTGGLYRIEDWKEKPRSKLVILSKENRDVLDAMFTPCVEGQCTEDGAKAIGEELGYADRLANFDDYMHHKYLVDIDGESWSSRFFQLLASGATVFKQATHYREFSDFFFSAGTHYERYAADLSDLLPLLKGALGRQEELGRMADRSLTLVKHLVDDDVTLEYLGMLLTSYTELFATEGGVSDS